MYRFCVQEHLPQPRTDLVAGPRRGPSDSSKHGREQARAQRGGHPTVSDANIYLAGTIADCETRGRAVHRKVARPRDHERVLKELKARKVVNL